MALFGQVLTAMITPFDRNGALNIDEAVRLARWLQENGNDGLVVSGTTGESSTLTDAEKLGRDQLVAWMRELDLRVEIDRIGNIFGTLPSADEIGRAHV